MEDFTEALRIAFKEDTAVLIEEFYGTEYRFFVLDNDVKAIMLRVPANVTGDGKHTVEELVAAKIVIHCGDQSPCTTRINPVK